MHPSALLQRNGKLVERINLFDRDLGKLGTIVHIYTYSGATSVVLGDDGITPSSRIRRTPVLTCFPSELVTL